MTRAKLLRLTRRSSWSETQLRYQKFRSPLRSRTSASAVTLFSREGNFSRTISECILLPLSRALLTEFYTTNLSVAAFPFEHPEPQRFAAQRTTHEWAEGREEEEMEHGERGNGARASGGRFGRRRRRRSACPSSSCLPIRREGGSDGWKLKWELEYHHCTG